MPLEITIINYNGVVSESTRESKAEALLVFLECAPSRAVRFMSVCDEYGRQIAMIEKSPADRRAR